MILRNARHELFAQAIARGANQTEAAKAAGYSERTACEQGSRLMRNAQIKARIQELRERGAEQAVTEVALSKQYVIRKLIDITERCTSEAHYAPTAANKSLELLGREVGLFREVVPIEVFNLALAQMGAAVAKYVTDEETIQRIAFEWGKIDLTRKVKTGEAETHAPVM